MRTMSLLYVPLAGALRFFSQIQRKARNVYTASSLRSIQNRYIANNNNMDPYMDIIQHNMYSELLQDPL